MFLSRIHDHLLVLIVSSLCLESLQQICSKKYNNTDGYAEHIADNSKKCSANTFGSQDTERCHSIYWVPNGYNKYWDDECFDVVTIYYNGEGPCCEGYDSKSIYPKNGDNKKGPYQRNLGLHRYFYVDICRKRTQIYILYVIYNQDWKIELDSLVPVTLKASDLNETPCLSKCHEAISKENLEKVSGPCLEDGCYEYELRWKETILDMPEYHRCFTSIDFYYGNNVECSNGEDCVTKGYRKVSRNPRESIDGLKSGDICGLADKAYAEFVTIKHNKSHEETRRSWVAMDLSAKITPCKDQCYDLDNPELPTTAFYSEGKIRGWSVQCTPNHHNNCYEKHGLTSYYFISLEDPENYKNWAKTKANNRFYWDKKKGYQQMVNPWRCFDKMTLFYNGDSITNKDAFDLQYAERSYYTNWLGDYRSLSGYKLVDDDPTWKTFTIYPRLTGRATFQVPGGVCGEYSLVYIKKESKFMHDTNHWGQEKFIFYDRVDFSEGNPLQPICLPTPAETQELQRLAAGDYWPMLRARQLGNSSTATKQEEEEQVDSFPPWAIVIIIAGVVNVFILGYCFFRLYKARKAKTEKSLSQNDKVDENP